MNNEINNEIIETPSIEKGKSKKQKTIIITSVILSFLLISGIVLGLVFGLSNGGNSTPTPPIPSPTTPYHEKEIGNGDQVFTQAKQIFNIDKDFNKYGFKNGIANFNNINVKWNHDRKNRKYNLIAKHLKVIVKEENNITKGISIELFDFNYQTINDYNGKYSDDFYRRSFNSLEGDYLFLEELLDEKETSNFNEISGFKNVYGKNLKYSNIKAKAKYSDDYNEWILFPIEKEIYTCDILNASFIGKEFSPIPYEGNPLGAAGIFVQAKNLSIKSNFLPFDIPPMNLETGYYWSYSNNFWYDQFYLNLFNFNEEWHFKYI